MKAVRRRSRRSVGMVVRGWVLGGLAALGAALPAQAQPPGHDVIAGEVIVAFETTAPAAAIGGRRARSAADDPASAAFENLALRHELRAVEGLDNAGTRRLGAVAPPRVLRLAFPADARMDVVMRDLKALPGVRSVEPNRRGSLSFTPGDPGFARQAADFDKVNLRDAWSVQEGADGILVAVIDTGVDALHPDLRDVMDLAASYNFVDGNTNVFDDFGHGTRVAGIVGARANNGEGIAGVAFGCRIASLDVADQNGSVTSARVIAALSSAVASGADVANMSLTFSSYSPALESACDAARNAGVFLVAASGNESQGDYPIYPASFESVMGVGSVSDAGTRRAYYSNYNGVETTIVDIVAPGDSIYSTTPGGQYNASLGSGTSFAAPIVSGAAALFLAKHKHQSPRAVAAHLKATVMPVPDWVPLASAGAGMIDVLRAVDTPPTPAVAAVATGVDDSPAIDPANNGDGNWDVGERARLNIVLRTNAGDAETVTGSLFSTDTGLSIDDGLGQWGDIANGEDVPASDDFVVKLLAGGTARSIDFTLAVSAAGSYTANIPVRFQAERRMLVEPGTRTTPQVLTPDYTYEILGPITFTGGITIERGTIIRLAPGANFRVLGSGMNAEGHPDAPIIFTALVPGIANRGGQVIIESDTGPSLVTHVIVEECQGFRNNSRNAALSNIEVRNNTGDGLVSTSGLGLIDRCEARGNTGAGIVAGLRELKGCVAENNGGDGLRGTVMTACRATNNGGAGIKGTLVEDSLANGNLLDGIIATAGVVQSQANENVKCGVVLTGGDAHDVEARGNGLDGLQLSGGGLHGYLWATGNGENGIRELSGSELHLATVAGNLLDGIVGNGSTSVFDSHIVNNAGRPAVDVARLDQTVVMRNGQGISGVPDLTEVYAAQNIGGNIAGGAVVDSVVLAGDGPGLSQPSLVQNTWVVRNQGVGIDMPTGSVTYTTIAENGGHGIRNPQGGIALHHNNIFGNGTLQLPAARFELFDDTNNSPGVPGLSIKVVRFNHWGGTTSTLMSNNPFDLLALFNVPRIHDRVDSGLGNGWFANYGLKSEVFLTPVPNAPDTALTMAYLREVQPDNSKPNLTGRLDIILNFSEAMDTNIEPSVTFGIDPPFQNHVVTPNPGWTGPSTWQGKYWVQSETGFGTNTLRVRGAAALDGWVVPDDTSFVLTLAEGEPSANNGVAVGTGSDFVKMTLTDLQATLLPDDQGLNIRRSMVEPLGAYERINSSPVTQSNYTDGGLAAATTYYYIIDVVDVNGDSFQLTSPIAATTSGVPPTPTPTPTPAPVSATFFVR